MYDNIETVLDGDKDAYVWPILQPIIEVSSRVSGKATREGELVGEKDACV
jgi:hypothetical protein